MTFDDDRYDDSDQHICMNCNRTCDCGATGIDDLLPDGYTDYCLSCSGCNESVRAQVLEAMIEERACWPVGW